MRAWEEELMFVCNASKDRLKSILLGVWVEQFLQLRMKNMKKKKIMNSAIVAQCSPTSIKIITIFREQIACSILYLIRP